ncbi:hypothetical protein SAMN04488103_109128 [Gemmobacter aquatilis]|uniref:META domain-containing protein n=1 Tax=Gemmobacter aquatilis TaxID=933059 RepID=A0A1H8KLL6_9RHOB|nr:hypothetical protein [Gemmobacter aquatilis]SEN93754.1 hypothetical protein SAMN04488103_109128 [Gemmobacter aquatilis]
MKTKVLCLLAFVAAAGPALADLQAGLSGRTLTAKGATIVLGADGVMSGTVGKDALKGRWSVQSNQMCRTITEPQRLAGKACLDAVLDGSTLTVMRPDGTALVYKVE